MRPGGPTSDTLLAAPPPAPDESLRLKTEDSAPPAESANRGNGGESSTE